MRTQRTRRDQTGSRVETDAESRQDAGLRRQLDNFEKLYADGLALSEADMIGLAFARTRRDCKPFRSAIHCVGVKLQAVPCPLDRHTAAEWVQNREGIGTALLRASSALLGGQDLVETLRPQIFDRPRVRVNGRLDIGRLPIGVGNGLVQ